MSDGFNVQKDKNIDDLIKISRQGQQRIQISSDETEAQLSEKMREMEERKVEQITRQQAEERGFGYINLKGFPIAPEALILISEEEAKELQALCFLKTDQEIRIGAVHPEDQRVNDIMNQLAADTKTQGAVYQISENSFSEALKLYATIPKPKKREGGVEITAEELQRFQRELKTFHDLASKIQHASMTDLLAMVIASAIKAKASDIHIEAEAEDIKIRLRIDGFLHDVATLPKEAWKKVVNRVKIIAKLKINVTDVPQDGRFTIFLTNDFIDVRVSTVPSAHGESIVMRLLMSSATGFKLDDLGLVGESYDILVQQIQRPNGMILNTGPTGSGKTTTLYAVLKKLNKPETKIITLENPIEYKLKGIIQSQVETSDDDQRLGAGTSGDRKRHYTYAVGLKSVLRQDPDVIMIGEIRDKQTAEIAIQAALTGHLMLSTLHTNTAAGAVPRLLSMEAKPFLLAPALNLIIGQRLVRRVCEHCKETYTPPAEVMNRVYSVIDSLPERKKKEINKDSLTFYKGKGCEQCNMIGYTGRIGIFELLVMNDDIQKKILEGKISEAQIREVAIEHGMVTMVQDGIIKAGQGITTPEEVFRVIE